MVKIPLAYQPDPGKPGQYAVTAREPGTDWERIGVVAQLDPRRWHAMRPGGTWAWPRSSRREAASDLVGPWRAARAATRFTSYTRRVIALADRNGLRPHADMDPSDPRKVQVIVNGPSRDALFGAFYVSAEHGKILRGVFCPGNDGTDQHYNGAAAVRDALTAWADNGKLP